MAQRFLDLLAPAYARFEAQFVTYGFAPIRAAWMDRAARLGEVITARTGRETFTGTFVRLPAREDLALPINENFIIEYYSR